MQGIAALPLGESLEPLSFERAFVGIVTSEGEQKRASLFASRLKTKPGVRGLPKTRAFERSASLVRVEAAPDDPFSLSVERGA